MANALENCPAPAKINLFLHVTGRRDDGYHLLQSVFHLIDLADTLSFRARDDGQITLTGGLPNVAFADDLCVRAARLLREHTGTGQGADIVLQKRIPSGAGLGGGSSDAATTLMALNHLWRTGLTRDELAQLGLRLGADVPFFIFGETAFVEGIGEHMQAVPLAAGCFVVVYPGVTVSTGAIFGDEGLTRDAEHVRMRDFIEDTAGSIQSAMCFGRNDLQAVACKRFPEVKRAIEWLSRFAPSRMSGSGSAVFAAVTNPAEGQRIVRQCPGGWQAWCVAGLAQHPMRQRLAVSNR